MDETLVKQIYENEYIGQHIGCYTLNKKYNIDLYGQFRKYNLPMRNNQEKNKKYYCDDYYFDELDTPDKAYWYGFILADGYISSPKNNTSGVQKFGISLQGEDYQHLEKLAKALNTDAPVHFYTVTQGYKIGSPYCRLVISSDHLAKSLIKHGCVEHKSNIAIPPYDLDKKLRKYFIRGYMEGNGSITIVRGKNGCADNYKIRFTGTDEILNWIMDILIEESILNRRYPLSKRKDGQIVSSFEFGGNLLSQKFLDYIYDGVAPVLERKYERYLSLNELNSEIKKHKTLPHVCDICGDTESYRYRIWHNDDGTNMVVCNKHYLQLYRHGYIRA